MDMFMDKLAQKLNAQEMIRANEAAELARLREQTTEYETLLKQLLAQSEQNEANMAKPAETTFKVDRSAEVLAQNTMLAQQANAQEMIMANAAAEAAELNRLREQTAEYEVLLEKMRALGEQNEANTAKSTEAALKVDRSAEVLAQNTMLAQETAQDAARSAKKIEDLISTAIAKIEEIQADKADNTKDQELLNNLLTDLKTAQEEQFAQLTEHVHKEDVKVYRNVQAVIIEEMEKQNEAIGGKNVSVAKKMGALLGVSVAALIAACGSLIFQLLVYLKIL